MIISSVINWKNPLCKILKVFFKFNLINKLTQATSHRTVWHSVIVNEIIRLSISGLQMALKSLIVCCKVKLVVIKVWTYTKTDVKKTRDTESSWITELLRCRCVLSRIPHTVTVSSLFVWDTLDLFHVETNSNKFENRIVRFVIVMVPCWY